VAVGPSRHAQVAGIHMQRHPCAALPLQGAHPWPLLSKKLPAWSGASLTPGACACRVFTPFNHTWIQLLPSGDPPPAMHGHAIEVVETHVRTGGVTRGRMGGVGWGGGWGGGHLQALPGDPHHYAPPIHAPPQHDARTRTMRPPAPSAPCRPPRTMACPPQATLTIHPNHLHTGVRCWGGVLRL
jgi:hypothetical protein